MDRPSARSARRLARWLLTVLLTGSPSAAAPPRPAPARREPPPPQVEPLATVQARAAQAGKALVLEFGADWCGPCREFEQRVLPQPSVQQALGQVVFVRYDAEEASGKEAARTLGVVGYPTFIARAQDGGEIARLHGFQDAPTFLRWIQEVAQDSEPTAVLAARATAQPADARALLLLGQRRLRQGDEAQALPLLERAAASATAGTNDVSARADWQLRLLRLRQVLRQAPRQAMAEHLLRFPLGPSADEAFKVLVRLGPADEAVRKALLRYVDAHKDPAHAELLNQAVYECLRAGALDEAERAARHLLALDGKSPLYHDTLAEVRHLRGDREGALAESGRALALLPAGANDAETKRTRSALMTNQARFRRGQRELPPELLGEQDELFPWEREELKNKPPAAPPSGR